MKLATKREIQAVPGKLRLKGKDRLNCKVHSKRETQAVPGKVRPTGKVRLNCETHEKMQNSGKQISVLF